MSRFVAEAEMRNGVPQMVRVREGGRVVATLHRYRKTKRQHWETRLGLVSDHRSFVGNELAEWATALTEFVAQYRWPDELQSTSTPTRS